MTMPPTNVNYLATSVNPSVDPAFMINTSEKLSQKHKESSTESVAPERKLTSEGISQEDIDYMAMHIQVHFVFLSKITAEITVSNNGPRVIKNRGWAIYFSLNTKFIPHPQRIGLEGPDFEEHNTLNFELVVGHVYKMEPVSESFSPGSSLKCSIRALPIFLWTRSMVSPNWYITANGLKPRTISATANEDLSFVFTTDPLSQTRQSVDGAKDLGHAPLVVIPSPQSVSMSGHSRMVSINKEWTVSGDKKLQNELQFLSGRF